MPNMLRLTLVCLWTAILCACSASTPPDASPTRGAANECAWPPGTEPGAPPACPTGCFWDAKDSVCKLDRGIIVTEATASTSTASSPPPPAQ
jgi:hypothetical protein